MKKDNFRKDERTGKSAPRKGGAGKKNRRFDKKEARFDEAAVHGETKAANDPVWYGADTSLMKDAASLPFSLAAGLPFSVRDGGNDLGSSTLSMLNPGIMQFSVMPVFGEMANWSSPFNVAVRDMYSYIRHANSGHANYDASDLGMYLLAYDSALNYYAFIARLYGMMRTVVAKNRYLPTIAVRAAGGDYSDLMANLANFRYYINSYASRLAALKIPNIFSSVQRHMWLFSNVFIDAPVEKAQMYIMRPSGFWLYNEFAENPYETFSILEQDYSAGMTYEEIVRVGDLLLETLLNNESFNIMSGDIIKAYGDKVFIVNPISDEFSVVPTFEPEFLMQIHNATVCHVPDLSSWHMFEETSEGAQVGAVIATFPVDSAYSSGGTNLASAPAGNVYLALKKIIDLPLEQPTAKDVAIATRFACATTGVTRGRTLFTIDVCGSEVITDAWLITCDAGGYRYSAPFTGIVSPANLELFGSHPYRITPTFVDGVGLSEVHFDGDFDNFTTVDADTLANIHRVAILSMFGMNK